MQWMQRRLGALLVAGALSLGLAGPAAAQGQIADELVNVTVGDITILEDVNIAVAARVVALVCDEQISPVVALAQAVDLGTPQEPVCFAEGEAVPITIIQNWPR